MSLSELPISEDVPELFKPIFNDYGLDITRYKPAFMKRRIDRRMRILDLNTYSEYALVLKKEKSEFEELFESLSINVTNFFRDFSVFDKFRLEIIPKIVSGLDKHDKIRIWSAGCASGEEAYSLAIMFAGETSRYGNTIEIIANDVSEKAITFAQNGRYIANSIEKLPNSIIAKNFHMLTNVENNIEYEVNPSIKNLISFKVCDILSTDAKQMDVILCRNVLIYYEREAQELIINKFYHSLKDTGYLVLGMDETMLGRRCEKLFHPSMARERIYQKIPSKKH
ncbi:MAG: protein-glutamate O-methyltransferase CheR [Thaumarchaeota archaeon]|nr:protein-glutamate O-methyltransferase CheR [Nitrososphaerota archaeon]